LRHLWKETLEVNPYYWLAGRQQSHARFARAVIGATLTIWSFFLIGCFLRSRPSQGLSFGVLILIAYGLHMVIKLMLMTEASRRLNEDRRSGALELLLATPLSVPDIIHGQRRALWKSFRSPIGLMLAVNLILFWLVTVADPIHLGRERGLFATFFVGGAILLFMDYQALTWTGMWWGLTRAKHTRAILATMLRVMGVPWLILLLGFFVISGGRGSSPSDLTGWYVLWVIGSCVLDGVLARKARSNLFRGLRETLGPAKRIRAQPFTGPLPILLKPGGVT
jgi:hypothetical protein